MADKYVVELTEGQRHFLEVLLDSGRCAPGTLTRALVLRRVDAAQSGQADHDEAIAEEVGTSVSTVYRVRRRFAKSGFDAALFPNGRAPLRRVVAAFDRR